jgi:UDP-N-acetylglucosamine:LPS N-acetylglucosamine transferase
MAILGDLIMADKRILILTAETGAGHKSISSALKESFDRDEGYRVEEVNAYSELLDFPLSIINSAHRRIVRLSPALWSVLFEATSPGRRFSRLEAMTRSLTRDKIEALFERTNPAAVISVVPLINARIGEEARRLDIPFIVVVADMARVHPAWLSGGTASLYCAPTGYVKEELVRLGVPEERIVVTGLPIRDKFFDVMPRDRSELRLRLGMERDAFVVLMMGGGEGIGLSGRAMRELSDVPGVQVFALTGRNKQLKRRIEKRHPGVKALAFIDNVDEWLKGSDLLITKSGPNTLVEAAASRVPTLFMSALPGQEQSIIDSLLLSSTAGEELLCSAKSISTQIADLMGSGRKREKLAESISGFAYPSASADICALAGELVLREEDESLVLD